VTKEFPDRGHVIEWIIKNQFGRRNLIAYIRTQLALRLESVFAERAKANSVASGERFGKGLQNSAEPIQPIDTRKEVAKAAGVSHDTVAKVKKIEAVATGKTGNVADHEGRRKGDSGEVIVYLIEQSYINERLLDPETNRTLHLCEIKAAPSETWQLLTGLLVEFTWSVKDTELTMLAPESPTRA